MTTTGRDEVVRHLPHAARFELALGDRPVSWLEYVPEVSPTGTVWRVDHTVTLPEHRGRGLAGRLVEHVARDAAAQGVRLDPRCPYVRDWLSRHPEHAAVVAQE
ncbi:MAG: GNAT family N-acetyltransferase [Kineosporiaceae bacterium]